ncbi:hypothetical protein F4604DRAFT_1931940 [Suillus subluteus]|nr:hypothetical protein F4604DRAFT_1931940 [Suillus subluteus]
MLMDQLELFDSAHHSTMLVADEVLPSRINAVDPQHIKHPQLNNMLLPESKLAVQPFKNDSFSSPYSKRVLHSHSNSWTSTPSDSLSSLETMSDSGSSTSTESLLSEDSKIPKPPGEPGHPGRGGYTLNEALDWNPKAYAKFKKPMHHLIEEHLDTTKCASSQNHALVKVVRDKAVDAFPDLENYSDFWSLNDMIMMCLKYTSGRARQNQARMVAGKSKSKSKKDSLKVKVI